VKRKALIIAAILGAGFALFLVLWPPEPKYQGRTVSLWLDDLAARKKTPYYEAIEHLGTNAIPYAVRNLALNDSRWHSKYCSLWRDLPASLTNVFPKPKKLLNELDGMVVFCHVGSNSIPQAIALLQHPSPTVRRVAARGLEPLREKSAAANQAIPALIEALSDEDQDVRCNAAVALAAMGADASNAVPALAKIVTNMALGSPSESDVRLHAFAAMALGKIGPSAISTLPLLKASLQETNSYLSGQAAVAIWRIDGDVATALPVLLREMPGTVEPRKWDWIVALGEMGPRAKEAVPQLRTELAQDRFNFVLDYVTNALKKIDPQAAADAGVK
jgi:HEAT repeat protein